MDDEHRIHNKPLTIPVERFIRGNTRMPYSAEKSIRFVLYGLKGLDYSLSALPSGKDYLGQYFLKVVSVI